MCAAPARPIQPRLGLARIRLLSGAPALAARPTAPRRQLAPCGRSLRSLAPFAMASPSSTDINHDLPMAVNAQIPDGAAEGMDLGMPAPGTDSTTSQAPPTRDTFRLHGRGVVAVEGEDLSPLDTDGWKISGKQVSQHLLPPPASGSSEPQQSNRPDRNLITSPNASLPVLLKQPACPTCYRSPIPRLSSAQEEA